MDSPLYHILTYGCQMNAYDSEHLAGVLQGRGMQQTEDPAEADLILVNTCVVRGSAEQRAIGMIGRLKEYKKRTRPATIGICGCMAQRDAEALVKRFPYIDLVLGTRAIACLPSLLDRIEAGGGPVVETAFLEDPFEQGATPRRQSALRALVPIMTGCNNWCSYCIVPKVRGPEKSRSIQSILEEIESLAAKGCREVTLVGQNVNSYLHDGIDFAGLLEKVHAIDVIWRIRYITSHPRDANARHIEAVRDLPKVCDHFHLPAQSGSTDVLERMNRGYTREAYLKLIKAVRENIPRATITTDLITGFPGETEQDFEQTLSLVREVEYDSAFTFFYNPREGTRAAEWEDDVPLEEKKRRLAALIALQEEISLQRNQALIGQERVVLFEGPARRSAPGAPRLVGRTTGDKCVVVVAPEEQTGRLAKVRITDAAAHTLFGEWTQP